MTTLLPALLAAFLARSPAHAAEASALFVGNSFTSVNDLPKVAAAVAESLGDALAAEMEAPGGWAFEQHANSERTRAHIQAKAWDFVVLQEQSQRPALVSPRTENQVAPYALRLDETARFGRPGTRTVFFETWAHKSGDRANCPHVKETCTFDGMQTRISSTYADLARESSALLAPVGAAWRKVRKTHPHIELYLGDGVHPSAAGTYLAACTIYATLFKKSPLGAASLGLEEPDARALQLAARDAALPPPRRRAR
ncbi:MAG: hypothetical protein HY078_09205 [Elusimicrobia bacterium]|nr:hypothetical protein [Elusimicrobiota bacterium]